MTFPSGRITITIFYMSTKTKKKLTIDESGSPDWRAMVREEFLYPNKDWFELRKQPVPETIEGLADNQLLIKLGGIKELAKLRGYDSVTYEVITAQRDYVVVKCKIVWRELFLDEKKLENQCVFEDMANATVENTNDFCSKILETIATNRAFVRCVRIYLNINIVGDEEIDKSKSKTFAYETVEQMVSDITPQGILKKIAKDKIQCEDFDDFKNTLRKFWTEDKYKNEEAKNWNSFEAIPAKECRKLISLIK